MGSLKKRLFICFVLFSNVFLSYAQIFVSTDGNNDNDGLSWNTALADINTAIQESTSGQEIWVKSGTYKPDVSYRRASFTLKSGVKLYGGFNGTEASIGERERTDSDGNGTIDNWEFTHPTILSGDINTEGVKTDNSNHVVIIPKDASIETTIDGFIIEDGYNDEDMVFATSNYHYLASGIVAGGGTIENCIVRNCENVSGATNTFFYGGGLYTSGTTSIQSCLITDCSINGKISVQGGGVYLTNSNFENSKVLNCHIEGESSTSLSGGGVFAINSSIRNSTIEGCFSDDSYKSDGGGIYSQGSRIIGSVIRSCSSKGSGANGGGIYGIDSSISQSKIFNCSSENYGGASYAISSSFFNCLVFNNSASNRGGGLYVRQSYLVNSNIVKNNCVAELASGGGLYSEESSVYNSVIWGNELIEAGSTPQLYLSSSSNLDYCAIENQDYSDSNIRLAASNNGTESLLYPRFLNPTSFAGVINGTEESEEVLLANWDIEKTSSLIENGDNDKLNENSIGLDTDLNGNELTTDDIYDFKDLNDDSRLFNAKVDIGAYESIFIDVVLPSIPVVEYGTTLGEITFTDGSAIDNRYGTSIDGEFFFANSSTIPAKTDPATKYSLIFRANNNIDYPDKLEELSVIVTSKELTIDNIVVANKAYDGTALATLLNNGDLVGIVGADNVILETTSLEAVFDSKNVGIDKVVSITGYTLSGDDINNYILGIVTSTATISTKDISASALSAENKQYDKNTSAQYTENPSLIGVIIGDDVSLIEGSANFEDANIGDNKKVEFTSFSISGTDASNYNLNSIPNSYANITPVELKLEGLSFSDKVYDGNTSASVDGNPTLNGILDGDDVVLNIGAINAFFEDKNVAQNKSISLSNLSISGSDNANYTLSNPGDFTANITVKELTVTGLGVVDKTYDKTNTATLTGIASLQGVIDGDDVLLSNSNPVVSFVDANAGNQKSITLESLSISGDESNNYNLTQPMLTASIEQISIEISADNKTIIYGEPLPTLSYVILSGAPLNGDDFVGEIGVNASLDAGQYNILQNTLKVDDGNNGLNYNIIYSEGTLTINKAENSIQFDMETSTRYEKDKTIELSAIATSGEAISFSSSDNNIVSVDNNVLTIHSYGSVNIIASEDGNNNYNAAESVSVLFTVNLDVTIHSKGSNMLLVDNVQEQFESYQWYQNGAKLTDAEKQFYHSAEGLDGEYYCVVTTNKGDVYTSNKISQSATKSARAYPSPAQAGENINVELSADNTNVIEPTSISIYNTSGKLVKQIFNAGQKEVFQLDKNGVYIIKTQGGITSTQKIIVR
ncbi:YDG domain-containing protein [Saccharicrinis aurantiacus]|uniref:YDG domain-containing protein n=1 Tax=Saccharicrinis aurantiacus TaxID=1849719 RepID=UPI0024925858|nr:YDG domain-containing protein [Saccharicrinis aurantiacus]